MTEERKTKILTLLDSEEGRQRMEEILDTAALVTKEFEQACIYSLHDPFGFYGPEGRILPRLYTRG
jgi:hypothetical protein